ncbi:mechanosensitive ion channel family protein [Nocardioides sp. KR10-350]|uniref:mechanosensitive ion channel family protein n=1 Tax=Nocardioides cheoyonin TaxID=3156615 RepID=UPI0032B527BD
MGENVLMLSVPPVVPLVPTPVSDFGDWARGSGLEIILLISGAVLLARLVKWTSDKITPRIGVDSTGGDELVRSEAAKHRLALAQVATWTLVVLIYVVATILVVEALGISLTAFVPVATVAGVAIGFGAQRIVQDLLAGFFLIAERQYGFGDLVRVSVVGLGTPVLGTVEDVSLRTTTVRTPAGEVVTTPNGQIAQVTNLSRDWARAVIDVPVPVAVDVNRVTEVLRAVCRAAYEDPEMHRLLLDAPAVMGVESIEVDQFKVRVVARTLPGRQFELGRSLRALITRRLLAEGISISLPAELSTGEPTGAA